MQKDKNISPKSIWNILIIIAIIFAVIIFSINFIKPIREIATDLPLVGDFIYDMVKEPYDEDEKYRSIYINIEEAEHLGLASDELNWQIDKYVETFSKKYNDEIEKEKSAYYKKHSDVKKKDLKKLQRFLPGEKVLKKHGILINYEVLADTDDYFSIKISVAIPVEDAKEEKYFTLDKKSGKTVNLQTFFKGRNYKENIFETVKTILISENAINQKNYRIYDSTSEDKFVSNEKTAFSKITGEEGFFINENNELIIEFDEGKIAPEEDGKCQISLGKIEQGKITEKIKPES